MSAPIKIISRKSKTLSNPQQLYTTTPDSKSDNTSDTCILSTSVPNTIPTPIPTHIPTHIPPTPIPTTSRPITLNNLIHSFIPSTISSTISSDIPTINSQILTTANTPTNTPTACQQSPVNIVIKACKNISSKQSLLMIPITKFFSNRTNLNKLIEILKGESLSLRLIDWFVTNYCKKYNIIYNMAEHADSSNTTNTPPDSNAVKPSFDNFIIVHNNYKGQLKAYSKRNFDPFCRRNRIRFYYEDNKYFITTVGQLNFFKWAQESNLVNYVAKHFRIIDDDMNNRGEMAIRKAATATAAINNENNGNTENTKKKKILDGTIPIETAIKTKKNGGTRKKRTEISSSASKSISIYNYPTTLNFD